jgi:hypothetical protein
MWFQSLLSSRKSGVSRSRRPQPRPARRCTRLALEQLEDRVVPTNYSAANVSQLIADINAANVGGGSNTITLTAPTTSPYTLTAANNSTYGNTGLPVIAANDILTIVGNGDTIKAMNGSQPGIRILGVADGASLTLVSLTLTGGYVRSYESSINAPPIGGGAVCNLGTLVLNGVSVTSNVVAGLPGNDNSVGDVSPGTNAVGGGIWSSGSLTLENNSLLQGNSAHGANGVFGTGWVLPPSDGMGGGLYVAGGTVNISNSTITNNRAWAGTRVAQYTATANGGGMYVAGGQVVLTASNVSNNRAQGSSAYGVRPLAFGGGLYVAGGMVTLSNDTVDSNSACGPLHVFGGGLYVAGGMVTLSNDTVDSNSVYGGLGGGIYIESGATVYLDPFTVANTINNTDSSGTNGSTANIDGTYTLT